MATAAAQPQVPRPEHQPRVNQSGDKARRALSKKKALTTIWPALVAFCQQRRLGDVNPLPIHAHAVQQHGVAKSSPVQPGAFAQTGGDLQGDEQASQQPEEERPPALPKTHVWMSSVVRLWHTTYARAASELTLWCSPLSGAAGWRAGWSGDRAGHAGRPRGPTAGRWQSPWRRSGRGR